MSPEALDSFGRAPANVTNAYILWALTSANVSEDLSLEINAIKAIADQMIQNSSIDSYFLALVSAVCYNVNDTANG